MVKVDAAVKAADLVDPEDLAVDKAVLADLVDKVAVKADAAVKAADLADKVVKAVKAAVLVDLGDLAVVKADLEDLGEG